MNILTNENNEEILKWNSEQVVHWAKEKFLSQIIIKLIRLEDIDGKTILSLNENDVRDLRYKLNYDLKFGDIKNFWLAVRQLQNNNIKLIQCLGINHHNYHNPIGSSSYSGGNLVIGENQHIFAASSTSSNQSNYVTSPYYIGHLVQSSSQFGAVGTTDFLHLNVIQNEFDRISPPMSVDGRATAIPPEVFKTFISLGYSFIVTWITAFVMVVVHERVPDMKKYPPLPDIFLDNVPHIPWAFHMCELTGTILFTIWAAVCIFHKYRMVLLRRFFGIAGTVFLLRCVTMLITSLSVPGTHLQCNPNDYKVDDTNLTIAQAFESRVARAYTIWSGLGMSIQGVRTCGDYMFSGHTVALTLLNFFITEYTPRNYYFLHTITWLLNMFGIFFILAAHEHYSIDVFVAFYITSRLFLYYHTLANNQALMSRDSTRTRIWFPMFSYFESSVDGIIPNEYENIPEKIFHLIVCLKDSIMLTARRFWLKSDNLKANAIFKTINPSIHTEKDEVSNNLNTNKDKIDNNLSTTTSTPTQIPTTTSTSPTHTPATISSSPTQTPTTRSTFTTYEVPLEKLEIKNNDKKLASKVLNNLELDDNIKNRFKSKIEQTTNIINNDFEYGTYKKLENDIKNLLSDKKNY